MKMIFPLAWGLLLFGYGVLADSDTCLAHVTETCQSIGSGWKEGSCNSVFGGFKGNSNQLHELMKQQFVDSYRMLFLSSHFSSDETNRLGFHKFLKGYSDQMWENGKGFLKYILKRGGRIGHNFRLENVLFENVKEEVEALGATLDALKIQAKSLNEAHKHSMNKKVHYDNPMLNSYDPAISHMLEEHLESSTEDIHDVAGKLNVLAKIAREDKSKAMGLHLFDQHLK